MKLTANALNKPAITAVMIAVVVFFGLFSVMKLPIQLSPDIERPQMFVNTQWRAASPSEMESEILEPIERVLEGLPGLESMTSNAGAGGANVRLEFSIGTDMEKMLLDVIGRMNRLDPLPRDATKPQVRLGGGGNGTAPLTFYFLQALPGNPKPIEEYTTFVDDIIRPAISSVPGVAGVQIGQGGGIEPELRITIDPYRAAELGISIPALTQQLGRSNDVSGGRVSVGRRQYNLRMAGRYDPEALADRIIDWRDGQPVRLGDIATVAIEKPERLALAIQNGNPAISLRIDRESGANVLATINAVKDVVEGLQQGVLKDNQLAMEQSFDSTVFIYRAINLLSSNLMMGVALSVGLLWWFFRKLRATLVVAVTIPLSLLATFVVLKLLGRTLNVISLAGLAFAVGMVVDAAIVVLENITRLRETGKSRLDAALEGTLQVWPALLVSTVTTVAIFIPILFLEDVEGQLFADLAITIAIAVCFSLIAAITVVPVMSARFLKGNDIDNTDHLERVWDRMTQALMALTGSTKKRVLLIVVLISAPLIASWFMIPQMDYLPRVKRDAVDSFLRMPPATNLNTTNEEVLSQLVDRLQPYMDGEKEPALRNYYLLAWADGGRMGVRAKDQSQVGELEQVLRNEIVVDLPDFSAFPAQGNLFRFGSGQNIPLHLQARDPKALSQLTIQTEAWVKEAMPEARIFVRPNLEDAEPELLVVPDDMRLYEQGWDRSDLGQLVRSLGNGAYVGEYFNGEKRLNIIVKTESWETPESIENLPVVTGRGNLVNLQQLGQIERTVGPGRILRVDRRRTITLDIRPPNHLSLESALNVLKAEVEPKIKENLPANGNFMYGGSADGLKKALVTMSGNFMIAIGLLFLLMSALFKSVKDSLLVVLAMPLAMVGGILALNGLSLFTHQRLDLLTMVGFVILLGLVVNNAILLVHQTRCGEREGMDRHIAVARALKLRLRPIFMSTLTSILGMLPLLLVPGEGSAIYRGLAAVIVGGMTISTLFTLVLLPCFLRMGKAKNTDNNDVAIQAAA